MTNDNEYLDDEGYFKFDEYCYQHGTKLTKGNCGKTICIDCKKELRYYLDSCMSCKYYECEYGDRYSPGYELCEYMYDNLKNWPFKKGCKRKEKR